MIKIYGLILVFSFSSLAQAEIGNQNEVETKGDSVTLSKGSSNLFGLYKDEEPLTTRYYLSGNALPSKKGDHYVMVHPIGLEVNFTLANNFSLGLMATWVVATPVAIKAKYTFNSTTNTHFAIGTIVGYSFLPEPDPGETNGFGALHYAMITYGNRHSNVSISLGYSHYNEGIIYEYDGYSVEGSPPNEAIALMDEAAPELTTKLRGSAGYIGLSSMTPISKKVSLIFDGMAFIGSKERAVYTEEKVLRDVTYVSGYYWKGWFPNGGFVEEYNTSDFTYIEGELVNEIQTEFIISASVRVQGKHRSAWQFAIVMSPISAEIDDSWDYVPIPSISWLKRF